MFKIAYYELKKMLRDVRWVVLFLIQPILVVVFLGLVTWQEPQNIKVSVYNASDNQVSAQFVQELRNKNRLDLVNAESAEEALSEVKNDKVRSAILININPAQPGSRVDLVENATLPEISGQVKEAVANAIQGTLSKYSLQNSPITLTQTTNADRNIKYFDYFLSALIVLLMIINCLNLSSTSITTERLEGTFERFFVTPYTKFQMIAGKVLSFLLVSIALSIITILTLKIIFNVSLGAIWLVLLINFLTGFAAISLGILISALTKTIRESMQVGVIAFYMTLILTPFLFTSETMYHYINKISLFVPFTYSVVAMREVNILGFNIHQVLFHLLILLFAGIAFLFSATLFLRRKSA